MSRMDGKKTHTHSIQKEMEYGTREDKTRTCSVHALLQPSVGFISFLIEMKTPKCEVRGAGFEADGERDDTKFLRRSQVYTLVLYSTLYTVLYESSLILFAYTSFI